MTLRATIRDGALSVVRSLGGFRIARHSEWRRSQLLILCYHGFSIEDEHRWNPQLYVPTGHLEARLQLLGREGYPVLPLTEGLERLRDGTLPQAAVAITVDDGNYDFYSRGYPVFQRFGVPVTVFVSTYYVLHQWPVFDVASAYLLWRGYKSGKQAEWRRSASLLRERSRQEGWSAEEKQSRLRELALEMGEDWEAFLRFRLFGLMKREEIRSLDRKIVDVQLHTHRHRVPEDRDLFMAEIRDNRAALSDCGVDPASLIHFCYPSGVHRPTFLDWLKSCGVVSAVTGTPGLASAHSHPYLLPRFIDTCTTSLVEFQGWLSGVRQLARRPVRSYSVDP